jgi:hypothetical protein
MQTEGLTSKRIRSAKRADRTLSITSPQFAEDIVNSRHYRFSRVAKSSPAYHPG